MITITKATAKDYKMIADIGRVSVEEAHRDSCSEEDMNAFLAETYNDEAIQAELNNPENIYHLIQYNGKTVGFSKILLNEKHPNIATANVAKLDRIYLDKAFHHLKLGFELLKFNIAYSKANHQSGMWLFTWVGNTRAVNFYLQTGFTIIGSHQFKVTETHYNSHHQMFLNYTEATHL